MRKPASAPGPRGHLIVFEGPDAMGKTTLSKALVRRLGDEGERIVYHSFPGHEPASLGYLVYQLHHAPRSLGLGNELDPVAKQLLHVAAHVQGIQQVIVPPIERGTSVVLDRSWWSTFAYGMSEGVEPDLLWKIIEVELAAWASVVPDVLFLVRRRAGTGRLAQALWRRYEELATREGSRYPVVSLRNDRSVAEVIDQIRAQLPW